MLGGWMDVGWMIGESGIKANSSRFSWSLAKLGKKKVDMFVLNYEQWVMGNGTKNTQKVF